MPSTMKQAAATLKLANHCLKLHGRPALNGTIGMDGGEVFITLSPADYTGLTGKKVDAGVCGINFTVDGFEAMTQTVTLMPVSARYTKGLSLYGSMGKFD